jgi:hypothetical protein
MGFQYEIGKTYGFNGEIKLCNAGFHFCENIADCFSYYPRRDVRLARVEALGKVIKSDRDSKCVTDKIKIIEEISLDEAINMTNTGDRNSGYQNTGSWNTGDKNTGDGNVGDQNTGYRNTGNKNTGDWNKSSSNNGCFMTVKPTIMMFNKQTEWTIDDWRKSMACIIMETCPVTNCSDIDWVIPSNMTDKEKDEHPGYKTTGGYLKVVGCEGDKQKWWDELPDSDKQVIMSLPNFDADIFFECTGIKV